MKNLPPLTKVLDKGPESGFEFERLMKKLLIHDSMIKCQANTASTIFKSRIYQIATNGFRIINSILLKSFSFLVTNVHWFTLAVAAIIASGNFMLLFLLNWMTVSTISSSRPIISAFSKKLSDSL
jgi:hypothetical protein